MFWWSSEGFTFLVKLQAIQIDHSSHTSSHHQSSLVLPCVVALIVTAVDRSDFQVGCLCSISPQQRLGTPWDTPPLGRRVPRWRLAPPHAALRQPLLTTRRSSQLQSLTELPRSNGCCWRSLPTMLCAKDERHSGRKTCGRGGEPNEAWQEARRRNQRRAGHTPPPSCWRTEGQLSGPS